MVNVGKYIPFMDGMGNSKGVPSLKTNSLHLKMDGWNTIVSFWGPAYFQVRTVSFWECNKKTWKIVGFFL